MTLAAALLSMPWPPAIHRFLLLQLASPNVTVLSASFYFDAEQKVADAIQPWTAIAGCSENPTLLFDLARHDFPSIASRMLSAPLHRRLALPHLWVAICSTHSPVHTIVNATAETTRSLGIAVRNGLSKLPYSQPIPLKTSASPACRECVQTCPTEFSSMEQAPMLILFPYSTQFLSNCTNSAHRTCTVTECQENYMIIVVRVCEDDSSSDFAAKGLSMRINLTQQQRPTAFHLPRYVVALSGAQRLVHWLRLSVLLTLNAMAC
ncbi:uncharacterized protein UDID_19094 [Ustilago sp. UG-2017a]|nr:uncharacterized protein UDID_19094 [Ustilago sp. UG-2017a]